VRASACSFLCGYISVRVGKCVGQNSCVYEGGWVVWGWVYASEKRICEREGVGI